MRDWRIYTVISTKHHHANVATPSTTRTQRLGRVSMRSGCHETVIKRRTDSGRRSRCRVAEDLGCGFGVSGPYLECNARVAGDRENSTAVVVDNCAVDPECKKRRLRNFCLSDAAEDADGDGFVYHATTGGTRRVRC